MQKSFVKSSGWINNSVIDHTISISKYNPLVGSSYIKLLKELDHPRKGLINIQNIDDNECFKWSIVKYLNHANRHSAWITNADKDFAKKLDFEDIKFPVKIRGIHKIKKKKRIPSSLVFLVMKERKNIQSMYQRMLWRKTCWLIIDRRRRKKHYALINDFNRFVHDHSLHRGRKYFCRY